MNDSDPKTRNNRIIYRKPAIADGQEIWQLVNDIDFLDTNSAYCYLILCKHFTETCAIAEFNGRLVGFITAYLIPETRTTLYVWQIGIEREFRGQGIATNLILEVLTRDVCKTVSCLEATVSPSNTASASLFYSLARRLGTDCRTVRCFDASLFPGRAHEEENMVRIGPFKKDERPGLENDEINYGKKVQEMR